MSSAERDWDGLRNVLLLLLVLVFCLYLPTVFHQAFADDETYLAYTNSFLRGAPWSDLYQLFLKPQNPWEFLPLRDFTYWLDFRIYGDEPNGFHLTNLLWYLACGLAVFVLLRELIVYCRPHLESRARVLALCGVLLFMVHPAHVEVAAWIASRKDLIAGTLGFFSLAVLVSALRQRVFLRVVLVAAPLFFLACFGKASAMTLVLSVTALVGADTVNAAGQNRNRKLGVLLLFWVLVAGVAVIHHTVGANQGIRLENQPGLWAMVERASRILTSLIGILLSPYPLRFYHDVYQLGEWHWLVSGASMLLVLVSLFVLSVRRSLWAFGVVLTFSPLLIYLQWVPFTTWSLASERFVFMSVAGLSLILIDGLSRLTCPVVIGGVVFAMVAPAAVVVWGRVHDWGETYRLLPREYALQPRFHNAIRDRIVFELFPKKQYEEAALLARQLPRAYAMEAMLALVETERAFRRMSDGRGLVSEQEQSLSKNEFCFALDGLKSAVRTGYAQITGEPDVSYNNLLRTLDKKIMIHYGDWKILCPDDGKRIH